MAERAGSLVSRPRYTPETIYYYKGVEIARKAYKEYVKAKGDTLGASSTDAEWRKNAQAGG